MAIVIFISAPYSFLTWIIVDVDVSTTIITVRERYFERNRKGKGLHQRGNMEESNDDAYLKRWISHHQSNLMY